MLLAICGQSREADNTHEGIVIGPGVLVQQVLSNGDHGLSQDLQFAFERGSGFQAAGEHDEYGPGLNCHPLHTDSLLLKLSSSGHKRCGREKMRFAQVIQMNANISGRHIFEARINPVESDDVDDASTSPRDFPIKMIIS